ncbi:TIGR03086 family protein [Natronosporangium hydrolyticum]|uniref:TIGR03086 family protein n=1 Tax=Natronosporangium hydrolyticum TaxID=2811111 RepID=A0A895YFP7_9ACTN|nr:TIGR03086 family metal-binding protein [Natronosporangium hydrolyticum]QSB14289.1 TIGR03086 family protein [Natronosporangium hydrolyticum]
MAAEHDSVFLYQSACDVFDSAVRQIEADQWHADTPCTEWDVRHLVNHVTVEDLWAPQLLAGRGMAEVGNAFDGDQLGADPVAAWRSAMSAAKVAAAEPGVPGRVVHLSYGDDSATAYLMQLFTDHLIHGWDLATAIGADQRLPSELVAACAAWFAETAPLYRAAGLIADPPPVPADADPQTRLLAEFGRRA